MSDASDLLNSMAENGQFKDYSCEACNVLRFNEVTPADRDGASPALEHTCGK